MTTLSAILQKKQFIKSTLFKGQAFGILMPDFLKGDYTSPPLTSPSFLIHNNIFDVTKKKSKDYYLLLVKETPQPPNIIHKWKSDFNLLDDHSAALESYVKAFQYKVLWQYTLYKLTNI